MTGWIWGVLCLVGVFLFAGLGDLVSEEIRGWLDLAPHAILRLAAARLDPKWREAVYEEDWLPELAYLLRGDESGRSPGWSGARPLPLDSCSPLAELPAATFPSPRQIEMLFTPCSQSGMSGTRLKMPASG
jgi:hypothetical protein